MFYMPWIKKQEKKCPYCEAGVPRRVVIQIIDNGEVKLVDFTEDVALRFGFIREGEVNERQANIQSKEEKDIQSKE